MVPPGARIADIGTDHALLPIALIRSGRVDHAVATEVRTGPFLVAKSAVEGCGLADRIAVRLGDGLAPLRAGEVDTAIIAGMGGNTIVEILGKSLLVSQLDRLILQPMTKAATVRRWLTDKGWELEQEELVREEGRIYEIISAVPGDIPAQQANCQAAVMDEILFYVGPVLWQRKHPLLKEHLLNLREETAAALMGMRRSPSALKTVKYKVYAARLLRLEEMLRCL